MSDLESKPSTIDVIETPKNRVISIDIFRGLTMAVMIFVNALSDVRGLPWWTYHAPADVDVMTYVDMVFPFFLFAVGMSLPLSVTQRLKRNASLPALWVHVLTRVLGLIALGLILANAEKCDPARTGMSGNLWALLALLCAALYLSKYHLSQRWPAFCSALRLVGLAGVLILFALFRGAAPGGQAAWLDGSYPEILGLIGYSYLAAAILYVPTRRWIWAPGAWFALLVSFCALCTARMITFPFHLPLYLWPFGNGSMCCIVMAGAHTSSVFLGPNNRRRQHLSIAFAVGFSLITLLAGRILTPLGISKIRATPTWCLYSIALSVLLSTLLYWICDLKRQTKWASFIRPAGSNTLLTYLLPDFWYYLLGAMGITYLDTHFILGWPGVVKTLIFTSAMLALARVLTKAEIRLQL